MPSLGSLKDFFDARGFVVLALLLDRRVLETLRAEADCLLALSSDRGGVRNSLAKSAILRELASSGAPAPLAKAVLGSEARPTKLTIFDKTPAANWKVPWHQDLTITVSERRDLPGYGPWTLKDGLPHVQPPVGVLQQTVAVRLHLDDTPAENGALRVLPGTHAMGRLSSAQIAEIRVGLEETVCAVPAGGAMLMSPLLIHASGRARSPRRRRVLHFEYSTAALPDGLAWAGSPGRPTPRSSCRLAPPLTS